MNEDQHHISAMLGNLSAAVIGAIRSGSAPERVRLVSALKEMGKNMPDMTEGTAEARAFILKLIRLLEGSPADVEPLAEPYATIYAGIVKEALATGRPGQVTDETREFLTQLAAGVVMMMKKGDDVGRKDYATRLIEVQKELVARDPDAAKFVHALVSILEGSPVAPDTLPAPYSGFYRKVLGSIRSNSR
jgi:hypothetical protein